MALSFEWLLIRIHQICRIVATPVFSPIYQIWKKSHEIRYNFCSTNSKLHHTKFAICFMFLCDLVNIRYCAPKGIQKDFFESCIKQTERLIQRENPWSCKKFWHKQIFFLDEFVIVFLARATRATQIEIVSCLLICVVKLRGKFLEHINGIFCLKLIIINRSTFYGTKKTLSERRLIIFLRNNAAIISQFLIQYKVCEIYIWAERMSHGNYISFLLKC